MIKGSCACGGIRFEIEAVRSMTHCHCTICRKLTGASFATYAHVDKDKFRWLGGERTIRRTSSSTDSLVTSRPAPARTRGYCRAARR